MKKLTRVFCIIVLLFVIVKVDIYAASKPRVDIVSPEKKETLTDKNVRIEFSVSGEWSKLRYYIKNYRTKEYVQRYTNTNSTVINTSLPNGFYKVYVKVYDERGKRCGSDSVYFYVRGEGSQDYIKPSVKIINPSENETFDTNDITIKFSPDGSWDKLRYYIKDSNTNKYIQKYKYTKDTEINVNLPNGDYKVKVRVYDDKGEYCDKDYHYFSVDNTKKVDDGNVSYNVKGGTVIEVDPLDLYIEIVNKKGCDISGDFINGTFFGPYNNKIVSVGSLVNDGVLLARRLPHDDIARGTFIVYKNGDVAVKMIKDIDLEEDISNIKFAITGFNMFPSNLQTSLEDYLESEWYDKDLVGYRTWRSAIGYNRNINKVIILISSSAIPTDSAASLKELECEIGIGLDSGGSTYGTFNGKKIRNVRRVDSRSIHNIIRW